MKHKKELQLGADLEKKVQHTPNEIMQEAINAVVVASRGRLMTGQVAAMVVDIIRELLHWSFMKPGAHRTPADILDEAMMMNSDFGSTDATSQMPGKPVKFDA